MVKSIMLLKDFIQKITDIKEINLVGPLFEDKKAKQFPKNPTIFVDGGLNFKRKLPLVPSLSVGDQDSTDLEHDILLNKEKDFSDLAKALSYIPDHIEKIYLEGFLGGRLDHQLANFGEIHQFLKSRPIKTKCSFDRAIHAYSHGSYKLNHFGSFSFMVLEETLLSYMRGNCAYRVNAPTLLKPLTSFGISNFADGEIHIKANAPFFILPAERSICSFFHR